MFKQFLVFAWACKIGAIHRPCGQSRGTGGRGVSEKTMFVHMGEGGVRGLNRYGIDKYVVMFFVPTHDEKVC